MQVLSTCLNEGLSEDFLSKFYSFDMKSFCPEDICRYNMEFVYPLYCYGRQKCDPIATDWFFSLIYAR
jgi:hypothetical protein